MKFSYFDIHSHLNLKPLKENIEAVVSRMRDVGVGTITVGVDLETSREAIKISGTYPDISWATVGLHPTDNTKEDFDIEKYRELAKHPKVVAIGETGIDYYRLPENKDLRLEIIEKQKQIFRKHIELAIEINKPLMIHCRPSKNSMNAYTDGIEILESYLNLKSEISKLSANFHFFVGNLEIAKQIVANGWSMSFDGPITFSNDYDEVIKNVPLENIMTETDAPFASPVPNRDKTCEPWMVQEVYKKIAEIRGEDVVTVQEKLVNNALKFFNLNL